MKQGAPILEVRNLGIEVGPAERAVRPVNDVSFTVHAGETLGLMGRSGAGKTLTSLALLGLLPRAARVTHGSIRWKGNDIGAFGPRDWLRVRGGQIAMVFQDPMTALHPLYRVDRQVAEALRVHRPELGRREAVARAVGLLEGTGVARSRLEHPGHPFEWSGGMRQRAVIAMAMANRPELLIADEPTTALDVTTQARVLALLRDLQRTMGTAILFITHDPAILAELADRVAILRDGRIVETLPAAALGGGQRAAASTTARPPMAGAREVLRVEGLSVVYPIRRRAAFERRGSVTAVEDVGFTLREGEVLAIVGESGCGKSTLARSLVRLETPASGRIVLEGRDITRASGRELRDARAAIGLVFQDPYSSLNPRRRIGDSIAQPLRVHGRWEAVGGAARVRRLLEQVELPAAYASRFPAELSGGERQRVAIARALALEPRVLVLDEPVSALDRPTQQAVLRLLGSLRESLRHGCILIAHDLRLVREVADRIAVMHHGRFVESGENASIFESPRHDYTRALLAAMPAADRVAAADATSVRVHGDTKNQEDDA